ncbi:leucine-rich repeat-containing protein 74B-like [Ostrinia furnacalis]|uniref:leucine-rich repeat-containing protein 74B-like n=1 Tax=Ostrinia furnacalis TaxID=93504 RepID=UPI00103CDD79|nr:leucine-rich repeat-containing protein 74B-like [Ostrinia furnacalis]
MSSEHSFVPAPVVQVVFEKDSLPSSEEPPMEEWSSLLFDVREQVNVKRDRYAEGLYDPGSGEICTKYAPLSASSVLRHPYYNYPGVKDPGIREALFHPIPKIIYPDDGQELYMDTCKEMNLCPIRSFCRQLLEEKVDLKYYGIAPSAFRSIAMALKLNRNVQVLDLTDNFISIDGCYHLGEMLVNNITLKELNLTGCRIGPDGARFLLYNLHLNRTLKKINLSRNQLEDRGVEYLARAIFKGSDIADVNLSYNKLTGNSAAMLAEVIEINNKFTHLDMSWNSMLSPNAIYTLCVRLSQNDKFEVLNLSWNALSGQRVGNGIKVLMKNPNLRSLNLSNNNLKGLAIKAIGTNLPKAVKLEVLDLSYNTMTPDDAVRLLTFMKERQVKLQRLLMDNVIVNEQFLIVLDEVKRLKFRKNTVITWGGLRPTFVSKGIDMREILFNRADAICRMKKQPVDIALIILAMHKESKDPWATKQFFRSVRRAGAVLDDDLLVEMCNIFAGPKAEKTTTVNINGIVDYLRRKWPDRQLPPTPPPEPEPEKKKKLKGKK